jgi:hypothetical protein
MAAHSQRHGDGSVRPGGAVSQSRSECQCHDSDVLWSQSTVESHDDISSGKACPVQTFYRVLQTVTVTGQQPGRSLRVGGPRTITVTTSTRRGGPTRSLSLQRHSFHLYSQPNPGPRIGPRSAAGKVTRTAPQPGRPRPPRNRDSGPEQLEHSDSLIFGSDSESVNRLLCLI